ncbi:hypothetical protein [Paenibacillus montanisoli]|uniref:Pyridoxamine 5'-phosphate oxidase family protein n=1 Tax=Paenibacillus montanisoli TaxID=2081970 RepID=A0A328TS30_9BACL|nr:hypothetical protein [Paenibacillus montanisoli]RAP73369.1 hypothetical protein DL346_27045 [Paenibacillus montanisoli]
MSEWPVEIIRFSQRSVPIFIHLAAAGKGMAPFICRGYGYRLDTESDWIWLYILKSQWLRLHDYMKHGREMSALLTSGIDNESYQFKGRFIDSRPLTKKDVFILEEQYSWVTGHIPGLAPVIHVSPSECMAVGLQIRSVFLQTPGPGTGSLVMERGVK